MTWSLFWLCAWMVVAIFLAWKVDELRLRVLLLEEDLRSVAAGRRMDGSKEKE